MAANDSLSALLAGQAAILAELAALRREVAALVADRDRAPALRASDREALRKLLPVIAGIFGDARFSAWEIADRATRPGVEGVNLRLVAGGRDAHALGKLLGRAVGNAVAGYRIERDGRDGSGVLWRCVADASPFPARD